MIETRNTTGLILAGGAGQRVDGRDKGLLTWRNRPLVAHVVDRLQPQVDQLVISCNRNIERYNAIAKTTVADMRPDFQGPLAGLEAAIPLVETDFLVLAPCDTPLLPEDMASRLLQALGAAGRSNIEISYAHDGKRGQYLCAALHTSCLPSLHEYLDQGHRAVHRWYLRHKCRAVDFSDRENCFANYNRLD